MHSYAILTSFFFVKKRKKRSTERGYIYLPSPTQPSRPTKPSAKDGNVNNIVLITVVRKASTHLHFYTSTSNKGNERTIWCLPTISLTCPPPQHHPTLDTHLYNTPLHTHLTHHPHHHSPRSRQTLPLPPYQPSHAHTSLPSSTYIPTYVQHEHEHEHVQPSIKHVNWYVRNGE